MNEHATDFDPWAFQYEYWSNRRDAHYYDALLDFLPERARRILDAGCGTGRLAIQLASRSKFVVGLDLSGAMLTLAQAHQAETTLRNLAWVQGNIESMPFQKPEFDYAVSTGVLHLSNPERVLAEMKRVVKPGGRMAVRGMVAVTSRWRFRLSYLHRTALFSLTVFAARGPRPALQITAARLRHLPDLEKHLYTRLTPAALRETCASILPGCQFRRGDNRMLVLWEDCCSGRT